MSLKKTHDYVELFTMLSWFSTFGGAYSNLGDEFENCVGPLIKFIRTPTLIRFPFLCRLRWPERYRSTR